MFAAASGRTEAVRALLAAGADPERTTAVVEVPNRLSRDRAAQQAFQEALERAHERAGGGRDWQPTPAEVQGAIRAQRETFLSGEALPDGPTGIRENLVGKTGGMTALVFAARHGHTDVAVALLDAGAKIDQVAAGDQTSPLLMATLNGHFDLALALLERGADATLAASTDGATPLFATLQTQWAAETLYPQPRAIDLQKAEYMEVLEALLRAGADPNARLLSHLWYWEYGYTRIGIDITGATPFWRAAFAQDVAAMRLLASWGADPHIPTTLPAVDMRETRQMDGRAQEDSGLPKTPEGSPNAYPIHVAAGGGYTGLGAWTVRAVPDGFMPAVRFLVEEMGADPNGVDAWGYRPIHYATSRGDEEMIRYLVSRGADVKALTRLGQSPADMARGGQGGFFTRRAFPETQALLESLGSPLVCLHVHFMGTGDTCHMAGKTELEDNYVKGVPMYTPREPERAAEPAPGG
jgi:ankyrin repeat protein